MIELHIRHSAATEERGDAIDFSCGSSFSEVETAKAVLARLASESLEDAYSIARANPRHACPINNDDWLRRDRTLSNYIQELENVVAEFQGTEEEFVVTERLLVALKGAKKYERWLDTYLDGLYRHPTEPMIGRWARAAVRIGKTLGREDAVQHAFQHVRSIPLEFEAKAEVEGDARELDAKPR